MVSQVEKVLDIVGDISYKLRVSHAETFVGRNKSKAQFYN